MKFLVVGGAGYIGSHMVKHLLGAGHEVVVADLVWPGPGIQWAKLDIADEAALDVLFGVCHFDAVFHFASFIQVGESVSAPGKYYQNNVAATLALLQAMVNAGIRHLVFSSSAAVYGNPQYVPIDEAHVKGPINPYGLSKWMVEQILEDFDRAYGLKSVCLRYFNAAGADPDGQLGERHEPETHLIPLILQAASGRREAVTVFGRDYDTPDGTCIRDYVHVADLASAHALAVDYLLAGGERTAFNLGNGLGFSVQQVIDTARAVTGRHINALDAPRRAGDPPRLVADASKALQVLGWRPEFASLEQIVRHAWQWELQYPWSLHQG
ncbi:MULTISPECIES: UDP-glucose 4-epimerase GalE [Pseudomonas]|jgi:UDP-glucose 4-epimerase|uniref:UDP-glucose 4-epimerase n=1 Tax=Pseudomonas putida TaxID=303 RepID=A0A1L7NDD1_PSEPU|nr:MULTISPECIES: UDP-glucose 4-epimerase GalE [Pseudomonas]PNB55910.1 UDP-glucose 4-epimerase GalE [Pseudomonas sp. FW305-130]AGN79261.1 UDP-glucose 4-epimerase [Pseudomonas putida H8234]EKT4449068.1 UDP-glucose 4-epimerase GalE [Pseudomonas putida]MBH3468503.1 UDP-glucose 4-epimerase GalE [Pseudomonas putida]MBP2083209.1 UDP-glucose 4-epimerase [Pseudomonas sp. PvP089]